MKFDLVNFASLERKRETSEELNDMNWEVPRLGNRRELQSY
jgi:hypothetical protein